MSNISQGEQLTSVEVALVNALAALATTPAGSAITKTGPATFANTPVSGSAPTFYSDAVSGTINSSNTVFTVSNTIVSALSLFLANSIYQPGVDFTVTGAKQITMTTAPDSSLSGQPFWLSHT